MLARAMSTGRGSAASDGLPGVTGTVRKVRGLEASVLMAPGNKKRAVRSGRSLNPASPTVISSLLMDLETLSG